jgi:hypothetical protein
MAPTAALAYTSTRQGQGTCAHVLRDITLDIDMVVLAASLPTTVYWLFVAAAALVAVAVAC